MKPKHRFRLLRGGRKAVPNEGPHTEPKPAPLVIQQPTTDAIQLAPLLEDAKKFAASSLAASTLKVYRRGWAAFKAWCALQEVSPLPSSPEAVVAYMTHLANAGKRPATIDKALSCISQANKAAGYESIWTIVVMRVRRGIRNKLGVAQVEKSPITGLELTKMLETTSGETLIGIRDRALLSVGLASACRRSELVALNIDDLEWSAKGVVLNIRRGKTDQEGRGRKVAIPKGTGATDPVTELRRWLDAAKLTEGAVFRSVHEEYIQPVGRRLSGNDVARIIKRAMVRCRCGDPTKFAGHSLRSGFVTAAARAGKSQLDVMRQTGHKTTAMLARYYREADPFANNAGSGIL